MGQRPMQDKHDNGQTPKKPKTQRKFTVLDKTSPERVATLAALKDKFPNQSEAAIIWAAVETFLALTYTGTDRINRRELLQILEDFWPEPELLPGEFAPEPKPKDRE